MQRGHARWEKVSKTDVAIASADYGYPYLALTKMEHEVGRARSRTALVFVGRQVAVAAAGYRGTLLYSQGLLQNAIGKKAEAMSSFRGGAEAAPGGLAEYLNLEAIRELDAGR
jgi:hypothetical protein